MLLWGLQGILAEKKHWLWNPSQWVSPLLCSSLAELPAYRGCRCTTKHPSLQERAGLQALPWGRGMGAGGIALTFLAQLTAAGGRFPNSPLLSAQQREGPASVIRC